LYPDRNVVRTLRRADNTGLSGAGLPENRRCHAGDVVTTERDDYFIKPSLTLRVSMVLADASGSDIIAIAR
jgi:hypothetical protein